MQKIKIAIVEDNAKLRGAMVAMLNESPDMVCETTCGRAEEALQRLPQAKPDVVLLDIRMPGMSGVDCVARLLALMPQTRIIMWTAYESSEEIFQSLAAGAYGYLLKSTEPEKLMDAIREVAAGGSPISGNVARKIVDFFRTKPPVQKDVTMLAPREHEVLKLLADGCPYKEIAATMNVSMGTVRTYIGRVYEKLHVHSRTEAVVKFLGKETGG